MKRILTFKGEKFTVLKHSSSGLGDQFTYTKANNDGTEQMQYLNTDIVAKQPDLQLLFDACRDLFESRPTLGNNIRLHGRFYDPQ
jgi:hypothetical protein